MGPPRWTGHRASRLHARRKRTWPNARPRSCASDACAMSAKSSGTPSSRLLRSINCPYSVHTSCIARQLNSGSHPLPRIVWDGVRVRRLSASAISLLTALSHRNTRVAWSPLKGGYFFSNGNGEERASVLGRSVDVLLSPRLIARDKSSLAPCYTITDQGREFLRQRQREVCAEAGRDCYLCARKECAFDGED